MKEELVYIEHQAGDFEDGLQVCVLCGEVICDYTGHWMSSDNSPIRGFASGTVYKYKNETTTINPEEGFYGVSDPYKRIVKKCVPEK